MSRAVLVSVDRARPQVTRARSLVLWLKRSRLCAAYLAALLVVYSACVALAYGRADDYSQLDALRAGPGASQVLYHFQMTNGRPLQVLATALWGPVGTVAHLRWVRLVGIIGLALLALLLSRTLTRAGAPRLMARTLPLLMLLLPAYQLVAAWATLAYTSYAALLAVAAALVIDRALALPLPALRDWHTRWRAYAASLFGACGLILAALAAYQPVAMVYWVAAAALLLIRPAPGGWRAFLGRCAVYAGAMAAALLAETLLMRILPPLLFPGWDNTLARGAFVSIADLGAHLRWFVSVPLVSALDQVALAPSGTLAVLVALLLAGGLWCGWRREPVAVRAAKLAVALALVPLSFAPNLAVAEEWFALRELLGLAPLITLYGALALHGYAGLLTDRAPLVRVRMWVLRGAYAVALLLFALLAARNTTLYMALPNHQEYAAAMWAVRQQPAATRVSVVLCPYTTGPGTEGRHDEFVERNCFTTWALVAMLRMARRDDGLPAGYNLPSVVNLPSYGPGCPASDDDLCLDLRHAEDLSPAIPAWIANP